jgi:hypothetical protein
MTVHRTGRRRLPRSRAAHPGDAPPDLTLTEEHALLLGQVAARAANLLAVAGENRWPHQELRALLGYLRAEVMRQVVDEGRLLFPVRQAPAGVAQLDVDHRRVCDSIETLSEADPEAPGWTVTRLATVVGDLLCLLEQHFAAEEAVLATTAATTPATAALTGRSHAWYPLTEGTTIDLDGLPAEQAVAASVERLLLLCIGEQIELRSSQDLGEVWRRMDRLDPAGYGFVTVEEGPEHWVMRVTRRSGD